jgi:branched-chain amino acid transport system ATP-binding protein
MTPVIEVSNLAAGYGDARAVRGLDLSVDEGQVVCLLGANGAGKTTTLLTIAGVLPILDGHINVLGAPVTKIGPHIVARRGLVLVPEGRGLFYQLTVRENLRLRSRAKSDATAVFEYFPRLRELMDRRAGLLSGGEQQMLAIAGALAGEPRVIMLDELSLGLAPVIVEELLPTIRRIAQERNVGVLLVEQHVRAALAIADYGYLLQRGRVVASGPASDLKEQAAALEASYMGEELALDQE